MNQSDCTDKTLNVQKRNARSARFATRSRMISHSMCVLYLEKVLTGNKDFVEFY